VPIERGSRCAARPSSCARSASAFLRLVKEGATVIDLGDPTAVLVAATKALREAGVDAATYGGLALAAYGEPRETKDADLAVAGVRGEVGREALARAGFDATLAFDRVPFGGQLVSRVTLLPGELATGLNTVDLVEPRSPRYAAEALARAVAGTLRGEAIRIVTPEDFVLFKVLSTRERDLEDAATVVRALGGRLDVSWVEKEARVLAAEITDHDVTGRLARVRALAGGSPAE
jgi:hypothetical protein